MARGSKTGRKQEGERVIMDDKGVIETPAKKSQSFLSACDSNMPGDDAI